MKKRKVISHENMPARLPIFWTALCWLVLDRVGAPGWAWGVAGTLLVLAWIVQAIDIFRSEPVEIIKLGERGGKVVPDCPNIPPPPPRRS